MKETRGLVAEQQEKLDDTKTSFKAVSNGIQVTKDDTALINDRATSCDNAKNKIVEIFRQYQRKMPHLHRRQQRLWKSLTLP